MYIPTILNYKVTRLLQRMTVEDMVKEAASSPKIDLNDFWKQVAIARYIDEVIRD